MCVSQHRYTNTQNQPTFGHHEDPSVETDTCNQTQSALGSVDASFPNNWLSLVQRIKVQHANPLPLFNYPRGVTTIGLGLGLGVRVRVRGKE